MSSISGGIKIKNQISTLKKGIEIMVGTPGRIIDMLTLNNGKLTNLQRVSFVVID